MEATMQTPLSSDELYQKHKTLTYEDAWPAFEVARAAGDTGEILYIASHFGDLVARLTPAQLEQEKGNPDSPLSRFKAYWAAVQAHEERHLASERAREQQEAEDRRAQAQAANARRAQIEALQRSMESAIMLLAGMDRDHTVDNRAAQVDAIDTTVAQMCAALGVQSHSTEPNYGGAVVGWLRGAGSRLAEARRTERDATLAKLQ